jgi:hypothetical protein
LIAKLAEDLSGATPGRHTSRVVSVLATCSRIVFRDQGGVFLHADIARSAAGLE